MINYRVFLSSVVLIGLSSTVALAHNSLGELLDLGGKKLSKADVVTVFGGASLSGPTKAGGSFQAEFKADGSYAGSVQSPQGKAGGIFGTWTVDDNGKVCSEFTTGSSKGSNCGFYYKIGDQYFVSESESDRGALLLSAHSKNSCRELALDNSSIARCPIVAA